MNKENLLELNIGDLVLVIYDCWIHNFEGSEYVREGEIAVVIEKRNKLMYKPVRIFTTKGSEGWVYSSNITLLTEQC
jgi:uncharacterized protein YjiK